MTIPNKPTRFNKREILPSAKLNQALGEYGSVGGTIPYNEAGTADTSFDLPLGTKSNSYGNAYFKGFNIYTQLEVQQLVSAGKLKATDRFVFWNTTTETICAWNGSEIITLTGGKNNMDYLFGDGSDGDVTMVADGSYDRLKNFKNFTLNSGITLTKTTAGSPLVIRCTETCTINGIIDLSGKGLPGGAAGENGKGYCQIGESVLTGFGLTNKYPSGAIDLNAIELAAAALNFDQIPFCGGGGAGAYADTNNDGSDLKYGGIGAGAGGNGSARFASSSGYPASNASATGGNGGGGLLIIARKIIISGSIIAIGSNGSSQNTTLGTFGYQRASGGGGGGGCAGFVGNEITITGTMNFTGGASGGNQSGVQGGAGGNGGYFKLVI